MIHTDGTQTVANAPLIPLEEPETFERFRPHEAVLLERNSSGFHVAIILADDRRELWLSAETDGAKYCVEIPGDCVRDAFEHPAFYIALAGENPADLFKASHEDE